LTGWVCAAPPGRYDGHRQLVVAGDQADLVKDRVSIHFTEVNAHAAGEQADDGQVRLGAYRFDALLEALHLAAHVGDRAIFS
jgi:hypothetical protein